MISSCPHSLLYQCTPQSRQILGGAKKKADDSFAEAQKTGKETTGQAASAGAAAPAISQVNPNAEEATDTIGDSIAAKADVSLHTTYLVVFHICSISPTLG